jgi:adenylate cyclase class 2
MAAEIELKARTEDHPACKARMDALAGSGTAFVKDDTYWISQGYGEGRFPSNLRVRRMEKAGKRKVLVTWKHKERRDGIEINDEREFAIGSPEYEDTETFEELLNALGFEKRTIKHKEGWAWKLTPPGNAVLEDAAFTGNAVAAELCRVSGYALDEKAAAGDAAAAAKKDIGWFLELEILAPDTAPETVQAVKDTLFSLLEKAGFNKSAVETRYYTEMLRSGADGSR